MKVNFTIQRGMDLASSDIEGIGVTQDKLNGVIVSEQQALELVKLLGITIKSELAEDDERG